MRLIFTCPPTTKKASIWSLVSLLYDVKIPSLSFMSHDQPSHHISSHNQPSHNSSHDLPCHHNSPHNLPSHHLREFESWLNFIYTILNIIQLWSHTPNQPINIIKMVNWSIFISLYSILYPDFKFKGSSVEK